MDRKRQSPCTAVALCRALVRSAQRITRAAHASRNDARSAAAAVATTRPASAMMRPMLANPWICPSKRSSATATLALRSASA